MATTKGVLRAKQGLGLQQPLVNTVLVEAGIAPLSIEGPGTLHPNMQIALPGVTHSPMHLSAVAAGGPRGIPSAGFGMGDRPVGAGRCHSNRVSCAINRRLGKLRFDGAVGE